MNNNFFNDYAESISSKFSYEETSEMGYRTDFEQLLKHIFSSISHTHVFHDSRSHNGNKPDFIVLKDKIPLLYIEVKDIGVSLDKVEKSEQMSRYYGYANLILSDYLEFRFYRNGIPYGQPIKIGNYDIRNRNITFLIENYNSLAKTIIDFTQSYKEPIRSANHLAKIMGGKGQRIRDNIRYFLSIDSDKNKELLRIYSSLKKQLVHDLTEYSFADIYAQTLVYGLFTARYYDTTPESFTRQEARDLIPKSNPLLRSFFDHITGTEFDDRIEYIVNELCDVFSHADIVELMKVYSQSSFVDKNKKGQDPVIHFYEDFLKEYDEDLRKEMGAYYTPLPVVQFIIKSVDYILKKDFGLNNGLADTEKTSNGVHKVQILDPAVGTGTFISKVIGAIYESILKKGQKGAWPKYVHNDLLPRVHGFELMMAPYTIAHLKIAMAFGETGFKYFNRRLGIYLTNSLEESPLQSDLFSGPGFSNSIAEEAKEASEIKNNNPIMVVIGNPPYNVNSSNKGEWIQNLIKVYKNGLNEKKINLDDDYIKFIRLAEHFVEKNQTGIVAMITNNSFISRLTHRLMRKHLLSVFDEIYIFDLHGDAKEKAPNGLTDENVFDIKQGVAISIFVRKTLDKKELAAVYHNEIYGKREEKFKVLNENKIHTINWNKLNYTEPYYFFTPKDFSLEESYNEGFYLKDIIPESSTGIETQNDGDLLSFTKEELLTHIQDLINSNNRNEKFIEHLRLHGIEESKVTLIMHKPFDFRWTYLDNKVLGRSRLPFMSNMMQKNIALLSSRQFTTRETPGLFISSTPAAHKSFSANDKTVMFPLYLYNDNNIKVTNLDIEVLNRLEKIVGEFSHQDVFDYIYAILHSSRYIDRFKEFLIIDFPRIQYPINKEYFINLVKYGAELRQIHLLQSTKVNNFITSYLIDGSDKVEKIEYREGNVYINSEQHFGNVPETAWNFCIGGYQPARKWLKEREGRILSYSDLEHYQKIIVALVETDKIMKEIDQIIQF